MKKIFVCILLGICLLTAPATAREKVVEYTVAYSSFLGRLETRINKMISNGWAPFGGICHSRSGYLQAMVRYEGEE